ncbi:MAG: maltose alpha-D-glucosyltransferase [Parachlamydiales bacterium]|nr:maltose alpha-D-glucosyltransferase [Parachlamydiales bacterium]
MDQDSLWYKDAVIYEVHVKSFCDGNGDGIGDFKGLTTKLDYIQELGVTTIWLLPFFPSPLKDDGYDVANYMDVNPMYGTLEDFQIFLKEAHRRNLRVLCELVMNHTSTEHEWFQRARRSPKGSIERDYYIWSDTSDKFPEARILFPDYEVSNWQWDPVAQSYYWHRFFHHQPDLNFRNPRVREEMIKILRFWLDMGVDGFRLDAIPYLYEQEGTNCENLPETHAFLRELRATVDNNYKNRIFLAEANQWPEEAVHYFGQNDECHTAFHFPIMPRLFMSLHKEDRFPIIDIIEQTPQIPEGAQWAAFLRNHDELTLEMITDEERIDMHRAYASDPRAIIHLGIRRRLAPLLKNDRRKIELMHSLLFSIIGTPVMYYGDEIGIGDNIYLNDRDGVRTPMQWSDEHNAGFSDANPQKLYLPVVIDPQYHYQTVNVKAQDTNPSSLLAWMRRIINIRKRFLAFGRGTIQFLYPQNQKVLSFIREYEDEKILVVANLSRFSQAAQLDLSQYEGFTPQELFSGGAFPQIDKSLYSLTLSPYGFFWFSLQKQSAPTKKKLEVPLIFSGNEWSAEFSKETRISLQTQIIDYLPSLPLFQDNKRSLESAKIHAEFVLKGPNDKHFHVLLMHLTYLDSDTFSYLLPLGMCQGEEANELLMKTPQKALCRFDFNSTKQALVYDASEDKDFVAALLPMILSEELLKSSYGQIQGIDQIKIPLSDVKTDTMTVTFDEGIWYYNLGHYLLKVYALCDEGRNPEVELGSYFSKNTEFANIFKYVGTLEAKLLPLQRPISLATLLKVAPSYQKSALSFLLAETALFFKEKKEEFQERLAKKGALSSSLQEGFNPTGKFLTLMGERLAQLHMELAADVTDPAFQAEAFTLFYQRSLYQSTRKLINQTCMLIRNHLSALSPDVKKVLDAEPRLLEFLKPLIVDKLPAGRIRLHGNLSLYKVLYNGNDIVFTDFQGVVGRPMNERKMKASVLKDVASLQTNLYYAAYEGSLSKKGEFAKTKPWIHLMTEQFHNAYLKEISGASFMPENLEVQDFLLKTHLLEKWLLLITDEIQQKNFDRVEVPVEGLLDLIESI